MPRTDPKASFEVATRHLFKHLHEPYFLKRNPLVRTFFRDPLTGRFTRAQEPVALNAIYQLVRQGAERCKLADVGDDNHERTFRQQTIVVQHCFGRRPITEIAVELGISPQQCYRERARICERIAYFIRSTHNVHTRSAAPIQTTLPVVDQRRFRMERASLRMEIGDIDGAIGEYDSLLHSGPSLPLKVEILCKKLDALIALGLLRQAEHTVSLAESLLQRDADSLSPFDMEVGLARLDFARESLLRAAGREHSDVRRCMRLIDGVASRLESIQSTADDGIKELYAETLLHRSHNAGYFGNLRLAYDAGSNAAAALQSLKVAPTHLSLKIMLNLCDLRGIGLSGGIHWQPAPERLDALMELAVRARAAGSPNLNAEVALVVMRHHAYCGNEPLVIEALRSALRFAGQHPNPQKATEVLVYAVPYLMRTRHWRSVPNLLRSIEGAAVYQPLIDVVTIRYRLRTGVYQPMSALEAAQWRQRAGPFYSAISLMLEARAFSAMARQRDAVMQIEAAISAIEGFDCAPALAEAYGVAAEITGERRFSSKAKEVGKLLSS